VAGRYSVSHLEPLFVCQVCGHKGAEVRPLFDRERVARPVDDYCAEEFWTNSPKAIPHLRVNGGTAAQLPNEALIALIVFIDG
jgi:hypothetical protein